MAFDFVLPDLGEGITEGEVRKWLVKDGDSVAEHQPIVEIETDKAIVEVPLPRAGHVLRIAKQEGSIAKVGEVLVVIRDAGEPVSRPDQPKKSVSVVGVLPEEEDEDSEILATPAVRAYAKELGIGLSSVKGSGPGGSITRQDLEEASKKGAASSEDAFGPVDRVPLRGLRRTIAKNLIATQRATAFVTGMEEADVTELWEIREKEKASLQSRGIHLTFMPFFMKAAQHALAEHPELNASVDEEREMIVRKKYYHFGVAVDTPDGLMVPVIRDAGRKTILELAEELQRLGERARDRKILLEEMKGSSFTLTNFGHFGGTFATPIINYPDVAILGTGRISDRPWVKDGRIEIRKILPLSLTFDHRVADGAAASSFLSKLVRYLEDPGLLFIESA